MSNEYVNQTDKTEEEIFTIIDNALEMCEKLLQSNKLNNEEKDAIDIVLCYLEALENYNATITK